MKSIDKDCNYDCVSIDFYAGKVAYTMGGVWALEQASEALGKNLGIIDLPSYQGRPMHALTSMVFLVYPNDSWNGTKQTAIRAFSAFLQSDDAQQQLARATSMVPLRPDVLTDLSVVPLLVAQEKLTAPVLYMPANNAYVSIWNGMRKGLRLHQRGALSTKEAVDFMQRIAQRDMAMMEVAQ
jgi:maltose-binding protein MalE